ncbi:hypothetical protein XENTR_v10015575 [Xenopus tropicalis]|nr:hypothetical protein XENTR_v10015575 [Xenopus tropicalis]
MDPVPGAELQLNVAPQPQAPSAPDSPQAKRWAPGPTADEGPSRRTKDVGTQTAPDWTDPTLRPMQEEIATMKAQLAELHGKMAELQGEMAQIKGNMAQIKGSEP